VHATSSSYLPGSDRAGAEIVAVGSVPASPVRDIPTTKFHQHARPPVLAHISRATSTVRTG